MRRWGSPKTPTIVCRGRKPANRYESERRRKGLADRIPQSCQVSASAQPRSDPLPERVPAPPPHLFDPHESPKTLYFEEVTAGSNSLTNSMAALIAGKNSVVGIKTTTG